ncbi:hypothetical protein EYV94_03355 [Puteibacter caeruleilacunae]|nr:hypothetical protein EYV94_03355 [Puteibacter caeruleilacunae]
MRRRLLLMMTVLLSLNLSAQKRDTLTVQIFTFDDITKRRGEFELPDDGRTWEKILMIRTLKCDEKTTRDKYPCGEWDYSTHTMLYVPQGDTIEKYELENFVTPYGKGLDLNGEKGWTYIYDVTCYAPVLKGKVEISSGNQQELLDMKFLFIEGTPVRDVISVENLYPQGSYKYEHLADDKALKPFMLKLNPKAKGYMLRARISGHGHNGPRNCCEWDSKTHTYFGNKEVLFRWNVWKNCGNNPIYPQGGTWQFDRAGWCPGTPVDTYDFELTNKVNPGDSLMFDYGIEMYSDNGEKNGNYLMSHQLVTYGGPNFKNDAAITDIIAPSSKDEYSRVNPICKDPEILIQNTGKNTLRSLDITYGLSNGRKETYTWNGTLEFLAQERVVLPNIMWKGLKKDSIFTVTISNPNGTTDDYKWNNNMTSIVKKPDVLPNKIYIYLEVQGHGRAQDNYYTLTNTVGEVIAERDMMEDEEVYEDFVALEKGCYELKVVDRKEDGMIRQWWYRRSNPDLVGKNGKIAIYDKDHNLLKELKYDFAESETYRFRVE